MENDAWLKLVVSSAVVASGMNIVWNLISKWLDSQKESKKEFHKQAHVYLDISLQLEGFVQACNSYLYKIESALEAHYERHEQNAFNDLKAPLLEWGPVPDWRELPVQFVSEVRTFPQQFEEANSWILMQWEWADYDDMYGWEEERIAFYGIKACRLIEHIRTNIKASKSGISSEARGHFEDIIKDRRERFKQGRSDTLTPQLRAIFLAEEAKSFFVKAFGK